MTEEKHSKLREIKDTVFGAVEMVSQVKDPAVQESLGKIMEVSKVAKEIIEQLKTPEMVKNIENFRLISENANYAAQKVQDAVQKIEETGIMDETKELVKSAKGAMNLVTNTGQDLREISMAIKEMFRSISSTKNTIYNMKEKYARPNSVSNDIVVNACEVERYLNLGWQYIEFLSNGKVVIRKRTRHDDISIDWIADLSESCAV